MPEVERCVGCTCCIPMDGTWFCDECEEPCNEIDLCPYEWDEELEADIEEIMKDE